MNSRLPMYKKSFIRKFHKQYTVKELAAATGLNQQVVRYYLKTAKLKPHPARLYRDADYENTWPHNFPGKKRVGNKRVLPDKGRKDPAD